VQTFEVLKTYKSAAPINSAAMSPIFDHVLIGGGQDAAAVTTTAAKAGYFEARFFHKVFAEEFANARGHFSPINSGAQAGRAYTLCARRVAMRWWQ
jgi:translation initiation factor 3 subunit I